MQWVRGATGAIFLVGAAAFGGFGACGGATSTDAIGVGDSNAGGASGTSSGAAGTVSGTSGATGDASPGAAGALGNGGTAGSGASGGAAGSGTSDSGVDGPICAWAHLAPASVDMYILLDQSGSMLLFADRWGPITNALRTFVESGETEGVGVGLGYFPLHLGGQPPVDPTSPGSCEASDYARPEVPIDFLPVVRQPIVDSLGHHTPGGGTPTHPALQGAIQYATSRAVAYPHRKTIVVLATDGEPQGCTGNDLSTVSQVAAAGAAATPRIETYVIGIGNVQGLNQIAQAGGTGQAFVAQDSNANQAFLDALRQIRGIARGCEFEIPLPDGQPLDMSKVNVLFARVGGGESVIRPVSGPPDCSPDTGGWYLASMTLTLCPATCSQVLAAGGQVTLALPCLPRDPPP